MNKPEERAFAACQGAIVLGGAAGIDFAVLQWRLAAGETLLPVAARRGVVWR